MSNLIGFARFDITPPLGAEINGYPKKRFAEAVLDPLYINAVAFGDGDKKAVLLVCDTLGIYGPLANELPAFVAEQCGISDTDVFICHTHTHTGPLLSQWGEEADEFTVNLFKTRLKDAARQALADLKPVKDIFSGEDTVPMTFSRRFLLKDGTYRTNGKAMDPSLADFEAPFDQTMRVVRFTREEGSDIVLINYQSHPDNLGGSLISADYPGLLRKFYEQEKENTACVFINGAEGNMITNDKIHFPKKVGYAPLLQYSKKLAESAAKIAENAVKISGEGLKTEKVFVKATTKYDPAKIPEAHRIKQCFLEGRMEDICEKVSDRMPLVLEANQLIALDVMKKTEMDLRISALAFGPLLLIGFPGEPLCETGVALRKASPFKVTFVCCQTNGSNGYFPNSEQWEHGGYEPRSTRLVKGTEEKLCAAANKLFSDLKGE